METLSKHERCTMQELALVKPEMDFRTHSFSLTESYKELCPTGFKSIWLEVQEWHKSTFFICQREHGMINFLDIGSGLGGVCLLAAVIAGANATGIELSRVLYNQSVKWHEAGARQIPSLARGLLDQSKRLICADVLDVRCIKSIQNADVIFINNVLINDMINGTSLNTEIQQLLIHYMGKSACCVTTHPIASIHPGRSVQVIKKFEMPPYSVSWTNEPVSAYITCRSD